VLSLNIVFIDTEIDYHSKKILETGAVKSNGDEFRSRSLVDFKQFIDGADYLCGHNIINHDLKYLNDENTVPVIDTLFLSPLLFPKKPYHRLVKDDKLFADELNNPLNDAKKARDLFYDEVTAYHELEPTMKIIFYHLLGSLNKFKHFFTYTGRNTTVKNINIIINEYFMRKICANAPIEELAQKYPIELAYTLSLIKVIGYDSITPPWVLKNYPRVENVLYILRSQKCASCPYCDEYLDEMKALKRFFHYDGFRSYDGVPLQRTAVRSAILGKSILSVFPTGGGKSITFQLPALMAGTSEKGLTVIISPLQSLMKDQTDNLEQQHNITQAVTINGSLDPMERAKAFERVQDGSASLLYISPELLRSQSIERLLLNRNIVRFVIDEAHCFSSWGQDFRVDYLYIGEFIANLQKSKNKTHTIPVSCFTATAKRRVITDIKEYFAQTLSLELEVYRASSARLNLSYHIIAEEKRSEKDKKLYQLLSDNECPTIIYVSRTKEAEKLAVKLTQDGFPALPYHGGLDRNYRTENQDAFMRGEIDIIVATTAFGMGVDKKNIGMVIHYNISDSLENYVQEAGRAGRDESIQANCYALFTDEDLNSHFNLLNQTKLSQKEIRQVWKALKELTRTRPRVSQSALEIARLAGWDSSATDIETRVRTAISALEQSGFVKRGQNMPRVYADSLLTNTMIEARERIDKSPRFDDESRMQAIRIVSLLISSKNKKKGKNENQTRVDYISDNLGIAKKDVIHIIGLLREEKILSDAKDLAVYFNKNEQQTRPKQLLTNYINIEKFLYKYLSEDEKTYNIKEINETLSEQNPNASVKLLNTVLNYLTIKRFIKQKPEENKNYLTIMPYQPLYKLLEKSIRRHEIAGFIINYLYTKPVNIIDTASSDNAVLFSVLELKNVLNQKQINPIIETEEIEDALFYLVKIGAMKIEGGFMVLYNAMRIERLERDNRAQYKKEHYVKLEEYYDNKRQQIHIVGEYANRLIKNYNDAMDFVEDYFSMEYPLFLAKYFRGRRDEITKNITPKKFKQLFGDLSPMQLAIINDQESKYIVVAAGPGSGKTKLLVHKLASLYMMEDVKHEQMLMLTFSRAAATEFKTRLMTLIGTAAHYIQISTFHSYCFDLLGKVGDVEKSDTIIEQTVERIKNGEVDLTRLTKTVLVIDEAQDMSRSEFLLVNALMERNEEMRIIAVGDDDQNIYEFRGSDSIYFASLLNKENAKKYELIDNYRSNMNLVNFANLFAQTITKRLKSMPIVPKSIINGELHVCKLYSNNIEIPVVNEVKRILPKGTTCIITRTNKEAANIVALLTQEGISCRLIQTNTYFNLHNLVEIRDFLEYIEGDGYTVTDETWQTAKAKIIRKYENSYDLPWVLKLLNKFDLINNKTKYKNDFKQYINESKMEDFISDAEGMLVSTIHQTKGREFDNVFLALSTFPDMDDSAKRAVYVALTRAKQNLYIYYNGDYFNSTVSDNTLYPTPSRLCFSLSHTDVQLGYFVYCKKIIDSTKSGQPLTIKDEGCYLDGNLIVKFSAKFNTQMNELKKRGYTPEKGYIRHVVFWRNRDTGNETKIVLPVIEFIK
jgi:ATP-dependent DNA helicase RecQ